MKSMFFLITIIICIDFFCSLKIINLRNKNSTEILDSYTPFESEYININSNNKIFDLKCPIKNCNKCSLDIICIECRDEFQLINNKCYSKLKLFNNRKGKFF